MSIEACRMSSSSAVTKHGSGDKTRTTGHVQVKPQARAGASECDGNFRLETKVSSRPLSKMARRILCPRLQRVPICSFRNWCRSQFKEGTAGAAICMWLFELQCAVTPAAMFFRFHSEAFQVIQDSSRSCSANSKTLNMTLTLPAQDAVRSAGPINRSSSKLSNEWLTEKPSHG